MTVAVLGIETSCDETAAAVVEDGRVIRSNVVFSQEDLHRQFGGVVPELASRQHLLGIMPAVERALAGAGIGWEGIAAIGVSYGPGLAGSLLVGVNTAKAIAAARRLPLVAVNHLEGHVYANWLVKDQFRVPSSESRVRGPLETRDSGLGTAREASLPPPPEFPLLCLVVSGGHTELLLMEDHGRYRLLGRTRDDAAGEAFDKVARILGLGYPGGPAIERAAMRAQTIPEAFRLTRPWLRGSYDFSFSGLKTAVLRLAEGGESGPVGNPSRLAAVAGAAARQDGAAPAPPVAQLAAAFQDCVVDVLVGKTCQAAVERGARQIALAGGVAANRHLRAALRAQAPVPVLCPDPDLCTDNAAMVASAAYFRLQAGDVAGLELDVRPNLRLAS
ncbi:MAG TPA: tRNA (adenosine(37)-N6)-threonylcarbamoyltransferase complex transferase subunit TsaD [Chloroflexota bacterium]|jgi:N6-L-threonylcarbamoyladenine synthase|nr:tRNA (adenosine(37)-N6)-threonylcarbamoyltransferase complex transferase subunit TsaD [Chloroflexota bacterium]